MNKYLAFLVLAIPSWLIWRFWFIPKEAKENNADFDANGAADDLQRGYHSHEFWSRVKFGIPCCLVPIIPLLWTWWLPAVLGELAMDVLLAGTFARFFTPLLNLLRHDKRPDISEWTCSLASKSWPDAKAAKRARSTFITSDTLQVRANLEMEKIVTSAWRWALFVFLVLVAGAGWFTWHPHLSLWSWVIR